MNFDNDIAAGLMGNAAVSREEHLTCPITNELFRDPVLCNGDGHTYERSAIEDWFKTGSKKSPVTGEEMSITTLVPNFHARTQADAIRGYELKERRVNTVPGASTPPLRSTPPRTPPRTPRKVRPAQPGYAEEMGDRGPASSHTAGLQQWTSPERRIDAHELAGDWCCFNPVPTGVGCVRVRPLNGDTYENFLCCFGVFPGLCCFRGRIRTRIPNTNHFRDYNDVHNVTRYSSPNQACNCFSCLCKTPCSRWEPSASASGMSLAEQVPAAYQWKKITAFEIAKGQANLGQHASSHWCCGCWYVPCGMSMFTKHADSGNDDMLIQKGICFFNGICCPFEEQRDRLYIQPGNIPTNAFVKRDDRRDIAWYLTPSCVGKGASCSFRC